MNKFLVAISFSLLNLHYTHGQVHSPDWTIRRSTDLTVTNFRYFFGHGQSTKSNVEARKDAINVVLQDISLERGFSFKTSTSYTETQSEINKVFNYNGIYVSVAERKSKVDFLEDLSIKEEYQEEVSTVQGMQYNHWVWMKIPIIKKWKAVVQSVFIPGLGQGYKGEKWKGIAIFSVVAVGVVTAIVTDNQRISTRNLANQTRITSQIAYYLSRADHWENRRNLVLASTGGIYLGNLLDVSIGKGSRMYAYSPSTSFK